MTNRIPQDKTHNAALRMYMVKSDEDAYQPNNLSHFTIDCEHYCGQKCGENLHAIKRNVFLNFVPTLG